MPAQAGIDFRGRRKADRSLGSGVRRNDDNVKSSSTQPIQSPSLNREPLNFVVPSLNYSDSVLGALA